MAKKQTHFTISEAAKKLGVTRAALHEAIKKGRLDAKWGETVQVIREKVAFDFRGGLKELSS